MSAEENSASKPAQNPDSQPGGEALFGAEVEAWPVEAISARSTRRIIRFSTRSLTCCSGRSMYGTTFAVAASASTSSSVKCSG